VNTEELNVELDYFRERIIELVNGDTYSEQRKSILLGAADRLKAAQDDKVPANIKATVLSLGKLVVRAAQLPDWTIDEFDSDVLGSILERGTILQ
jgi:hypothetical protein